ncbi:DUF4136 domain-containing protein [Qipengyuania sp.]|uniref:DUF4136 domain-containing protein n=1 Tax=Qipengyuania sp. TaxID=2004515 RepID=UPI0035C8121F
MLRPLAITAAMASLALSGCATPQGPAEVTRFVAPESVSRLGQGAVFLESAPGTADALELAPYKAAVAAELVRLGYRETDRAAAGQIAQVGIERYVQTAEGRRSPVSVGVGGSTGSYGSGVGLGLGINLGGGARDSIGTQLSVTLRDAASGEPLWEGRADLRAADNSPLADRTRNAQALAAALFRGFPGTNGETVEVEVNE